MIKIFIPVLIFVLSGCVQNEVHEVHEDKINKVVEKNVISSEKNICSYETVSEIGTQSIIKNCDFAKIGDYLKWRPII